MRAQKCAIVYTSYDTHTQGLYAAVLARYRWPTLTPSAPFKRYRRAYRAQYECGQCPGIRHPPGQCWPAAFHRPFDGPPEYGRVGTRPPGTEWTWKNLFVRGTRRPLRRRRNIKIQSGFKCSDVLTRCAPTSNRSYTLCSVWFKRFGTRVVRVACHLRW